MESETERRRRAEVDSLMHSVINARTQAKDLLIERDALRAEIERLTAERDYWERARNEWEKSCNIVQYELAAAEAALATAREVTPAMVHAFMATYQDHSWEYVYNAVEAGLKAALAALPAAPETK